MDDYKVYMHISPEGKKYIGMTRRPMSQRTRGNGKGYVKNKLFYSDIVKFGWDSFIHVVIKDHMSAEEAEKLEILLIEKLNTADGEHGYNLSTGGKCGASGLYGEKNHMYGVHRSEETKTKIKQTKALHPQTFTDERRARVSKAIKERWNDPEYRRKCGSTCKGRTGALHPMYGKHGAEHPGSRKIINLDTLEVFDSAVEAAKATNGNHSKICMVCRGERNTSGGYRWAWYSEYKGSVSV